MVVVALVAVWGVFLAHGVVKARHGQRFTALLSHMVAIGALALVFKTASDWLITYPWPGWLVVALIAVGYGLNPDHLDVLLSPSYTQSKASWRSFN